MPASVISRNDELLKLVIISLDEAHEEELDETELAVAQKVQQLEDIQCKVSEVAQAPLLSVQRRCLGS
jgi:hypothetical protein